MRRNVRAALRRAFAAHRRRAAMSGPPTPDERASQYTGVHGARYFEYQRDSGLSSAAIDRRSFQRHIEPDQVVVDFGCGGGYMLEALDAEERIGIEVNDVARAEAHARGIRTVGSANELPTEWADVVISNHALEHVLHPYSELCELRRILKPGGKLVIRLPLDDWRTQRRYRDDDPNHHLYAWTPLLLGNLLSEAGFTVKECRIVACSWPPFHAQLFRLLPRTLFDLAGCVSARVRGLRQLTAVAVRPGSIR
jgi:SAM-dependent methyltransferase